MVLLKLSQNCKSLVWEVDCLTFLEVHSCQPSLVLLISCIKCCVSKLREAAETWLRIPRKHQRPGEDRTIIIIIIITIITTVFIWLNVVTFTKFFRVSNAAFIQGWCLFKGSIYFQITSFKSLTTVIVNHL